MAARCEAMGVEFRLGVTAQRFVVDGDRVTGVQTDAGLLTADNYVLALGIQNPFLARSAGQRLAPPGCAGVCPGDSRSGGDASH
jgi:D-amino-acid dehydrogenase